MRPGVLGAVPAACLLSEELAWGSPVGGWGLSVFHPGGGLCVVGTLVWVHVGARVGLWFLVVFWHLRVHVDTCVWLPSACVYE